MNLRISILLLAIAVANSLNAGCFMADPRVVAAANVATPMIRFDRSQREVFEDQARVIAVNFHRQKGKDFVASAKAVDEAIETGQNWFIIAMTQAQADETFLKAKKCVDALKGLLKKKFGSDRVTEEHEDFKDYDREIDHAFEARAHTLVMPNGARVVSLPGRNPDALAGRTGNQIWTEFGLWAKGGYEHWSTLFPIITRGAFKLMLISTPRGRNTKFYEVMSNEDGLYSTHTCDIYKSVFEEGYQLYDAKGQPFPQRNRVEQELAIATFRKMYHDEAKWPREYECQFTGDLSALINWAMIERAAAMGIGLPFDFIRIDGERPLGDVFLHLRNEINAGARCEIGWDVARKKTGDISSVVLNLARANRPKHLRFNVMMKDSPFEFMRSVARGFMDLQRFSVGHGDATGLGMESNEVLERIYRVGAGESRWTPFTFTATGKREIASALFTAFSDGTQTLPPLNGPAKYVATDVYAIQKDDSGSALLLDEGVNPLLPDSHCDVAYSVGLCRVAGASNVIRTLPAPLMRKPVGF